MNKNIIIYTSSLCGFCYRAKSLLKKKNIPFEEIDIDLDVEKKISELQEAKLNGKNVNATKELKEWVIAKSRENSYLVYTDVAKDVKDIISGGPVPKHIKPIWPFISFTAFNTLPEEFKKIYGIKTTNIKSLILKFNLLFLKFTRPFLPPFFRLIPPARWAKQRLTKNPNLRFTDKAKI